MSAEAPVPGRVVITARAQERVFRALAADELGVPVKSAKVRVADDAGRIAADITSPAMTGPRTAPLLSLIESTRRRLLDDGARITGAEISKVAVRITNVTNIPGRVQ